MNWQNFPSRDGKAMLRHAIKAPATGGFWGGVGSVGTAGNPYTQTASAGGSTTTMSYY